MGVKIDPYPVLVQLTEDSTMKEWVQLSTDAAPAIGATIEKIPEERTETPEGGFATRLDDLGVCTGRIIQVGAHWANQPEGRSGWWVLVEYDTPDYSRFCEHYGHEEGSPESLREYREYAENRATLDGLAAEPSEGGQAGAESPESGLAAAEPPEARRYPTARDMGPTLASDLEQWAASRETDMPVAVAIHAVSEPKQGRTAEDIWGSPTPAEVEQIRAAVAEYIAKGDYPAADGGRYEWGADSITVGYCVVFVPLKAGAYRLIDTDASEAAAVLAEQQSRDARFEPLVIESAEHADRLQDLGQLGHEYRQAFREAAQRFRDPPVEVEMLNPWSGARRLPARGKALLGSVQRNRTKNNARRWYATGV